MALTDNDISLLFENAKSFNMIDKSRLILEGRPLQEQFYITSHFIQDKIFCYQAHSNEFYTKSSTNKLLIDQDIVLKFNVMQIMDHMQAL